jgi:hypothetical protein
MPPEQRSRFFHVIFYLGQDPELVLGFNIGEAGLELLLPGGVLLEGIALDGLAAGIEIQKILGHLDHFLPNAGFGDSPADAPQAAGGGIMMVRPDISR